MMVARALLSTVLVLAAFLFAVVSPITATVTVKRRRRVGDRHGVSGMPIVGSVFGFVAVLVAPVASLGVRVAWSWVPVAIEASVLGLCWVYWIASSPR